MTEKELFEMLIHEQKKIIKIYKRERLYTTILTAVSVLTIIGFHLVIRLWK